MADSEDSDDDADDGDDDDDDDDDMGDDLYEPQRKAITKKGTPGKVSIITLCEYVTTKTRKFSKSGLVSCLYVAWS